VHVHLRRQRLSVLAQTTVAVRYVAALALAVVAFSAGWFVRGRYVAPPSHQADKVSDSVDLPADFWMEMQAHKAMLRHVADICEQAVRSDRSPVAGAARAPEAVPEKAERKVASDAVQAAAVPSNPQEVTATRSLVDDAVARGKWTDQDAIAFRERTAKMNPSEKQEAFTLLMRAINERGVRNASGGPPF
jgi:hypothetical protein